MGRVTKWGSIATLLIIGIGCATLPRHPHQCNHALKFNVGSIPVYTDLSSQAILFQKWGGISHPRKCLN